MFNSFARRLSRIGNVLKFLSPEEIDDRFLDNEKNLYKRDIITAALNLELFEEDLVSSTVLAKEINKIGRLAFAGGPQANRCAGTYIPNFAHLLNRSYIRAELGLSVIKTLCIITITNAENQRMCFEEGLHVCMGSIIPKFKDGMRLWAVYCLYCMILDNVPLLQIFKEHKDIIADVYVVTKANWSGFSHNYATMLLKVSGVEPIVKKARSKKKVPRRSSSKGSPDGSSDESFSIQEDKNIARVRGSSRATSVDLEIVDEAKEPKEKILDKRSEKSYGET